MTLNIIKEINEAHTGDTLGTLILTLLGFFHWQICFFGMLTSISCPIHSIPMVDGLNKLGCKISPRQKKLTITIRPVPAERTKTVAPHTGIAVLRVNYTRAYQHR